MNTFAASPRGRCTKTWVVAGFAAGTIELTNRCVAEGGLAAFNFGSGPDLLLGE